MSSSDGAPTATTGRGKAALQVLPMFDGHDPRWRKGKPLMKRLFDMPGNQAMSDAEFAACQSFVDDTLMMSEWPRDNFERQIEFVKMIRKSYTGCVELGLNVPWRVLKAKHDRDNHDMSSRDPLFRVLPRFKEVDEKCYVAYFETDALGQRTRKTEWVEFNDDYVRSIA